MIFYVLNLSLLFQQKPTTFPRIPAVLVKGRGNIHGRKSGHDGRVEHQLLHHLGVLRGKTAARDGAPTPAENVHALFAASFEDEPDGGGDILRGVVGVRLRSGPMFCLRLAALRRAAAELYNIRAVRDIGEQERRYPNGSLLAHVLGFCDIDNRGQAGIE